MKSKLFLSLLFILVCQSVRSESEFDIVRYSCLNNANYLNISHEQLILFSTAKNFENIDYPYWKNAGFHSPKGLNKTCKFEKSEYQLTTSQSNGNGSGMCSAQPEVTLNLLRNGIPIINNVKFGYSCYGNNTVTSIVVLEKSKDYDPEFLKVCYRSIKLNEEGEFCKIYFDAYSKVKNPLPITQETVNAIQKNS